MIKFIKLEKKHSFLHIAGLKQRSEYLKVINDSVESLSMEFRFMNYGIYISGWHLIIPIMIAMYFAFAIWYGIGIDLGIVGGVICVVLLTGLILAMTKIILAITGTIIRLAFNL